MSLKNRITAAASRALYSAFNVVGVQLPPIQYDFVNYDGKDVYSRDAAKLEAYYSNAYRACALAKARPLAALPVHVYERDSGVRKPAAKRAAKDLETLLRTKWNPLMSAQEGIRWLDMTKDLKGEAFVRVEWRNARIVALWPMSGTPGIEIIRGGSHVFNYGGDKFTAPGRYLENEIVWVKSPILDSDCLHGRSLAEFAANEVGLSVDLEKFYSHILNGEGNFPGWLETDQSLKEPEFKKLKQQLEDGGGIVNSGKIRIFDHGLQYKSTSQSMVDMSLVEQERWILQQVCRTLSVPPQEVFDLSNATYSNIEQGALNFANKTLMPECAEIERAFSSVLWSIGLKDCYVQFDMNGLLRGGYRDRMEGYKAAVFSGWMMPAEVRAKEDLPPVEGLDVLFIPSSYNLLNADTGELTITASHGSEPGSSGEGGAPYSGDGNGDAMNSIHDDMVERIKQRISEAGDTEKTRAFATKVLKPYANACLLARREYDIEADIKEIFEHEGH